MPSSSDPEPHDEPRSSKAAKPSDFELPSMDDRKRFLGCLAAVLASSYDYELCVISSAVGNRASATASNNNTSPSASSDKEDPETSVSNATINNNEQSTHHNAAIPQPDTTTTDTAMNDGSDRPPWLDGSQHSVDSNSSAHNLSMFLDALDDQGKVVDDDASEQSSMTNDRSESSMLSALEEPNNNNKNNNNNNNNKNNSNDQQQPGTATTTRTNNDHSSSSIVEQELNNLHDHMQQQQQQQQQRKSLGSRFQTWRKSRLDNKQDIPKEHEPTESSPTPHHHPRRPSARRLARRAARKQAKQQQTQQRLSKAQQEFRRAQERHVVRRHQVAVALLQHAMEQLLFVQQQEEHVDKEEEYSEVLMAQLQTELLPLLDRLRELPTTKGGVDGKNAATATNQTTFASSPSTPTRLSRFSLQRLSTGGTNNSMDSTHSSDDGNNNNTDKDDKDDNDDPPEQLSDMSKFGGKLTNREWADHDTTLRQYLTLLSPGAGFACLAWLLLQHLLSPKTSGYDARTRYALKTLGVAVLVQDMERVQRAAFLAGGTMTTNAQFGSDDSLDDADVEDRYHEWKTRQYTDWVAHATRKFENLEHAIADRLLRLAAQPSSPQQQAAPGGGGGVSIDDLEADDHVEVVVAQTQKNQRRVPSKKQIVRGLKIGGAGIVAGTLLAVTGGLAAPAIAGALTALGMGAVASTFMSVASTTAVIHLFGVAGGSLAAYKMNRRTAGLTEFTIRQETNDGRGLRKRHVEDRHKNKQQVDNHAEHSLDDLEADELNPNFQKEQKLRNSQKQPSQQPKRGWFGRRRSQQTPQQQEHDSGEVDQKAADNTELYRTICVSGWLQDSGGVDFTRPWGVQPTVKKTLEKLQRFYTIYNPSMIPYCENLWKRWKKEATTFFQLLEDKYGSNPNHLFPLSDGPMLQDALTKAEDAIVDNLIVELAQRKSGDGQAQAIEAKIAKNEPDKNAAPTPQLGEQGFSNMPTLENEPIVLTIADDQYNHSGAVDTYRTIDDNDTSSPRQYDEELMSCPHHYASVFEQVPPPANKKNFATPAHLATVWDYGAHYGGELYTVQWESALLARLCACVRDIAITAVGNAGQDVVYHIVGSTFALFLYLPVAVIQAMNSIDETWALVVNRSDEAGRELARSLLINQAGHRPVTLVGFSFGARVIYSCLKTLAVYQEQWEDVQEERRRAALSVYDEEHDDDQPRRSRKTKKRKPLELEFDREPASVVEDVILMGGPFYLSLSSWKACRQVVSGRLVNVYSRKDKILSLMFKFKQIYQSHKPVCGTCTVSVPGVENVDVSDIIESHSDYCYAVGKCLQRVRHGQPLRSASNALDEEAILAHAEKLVQEQTEKGEDTAVVEDGVPATSAGADSE